ncbi:1-acyl-sn-glycerol-3-phosphate acyltransferase [Actibacterium sp. 188UL27-1]|nr:1-acyl-sn-glycerol-3-phosphate acyltransferase [Actibacterium sp. 188UL27-1]
MVEPMRDRLDPLIAERAPWLFADRPGTQQVRRVLDRVLSYNRTVEIAKQLEHTTGPQLMDHVASLIAREVTVDGLDRIPAKGPALVVANHPTGIADGVIMWSVLAKRRPDLFYYANVDILRAVPQLESMIAPVEWRVEKRTHGKTRETMAYTRQAITDGRLGVIFPSGRLAKRRNLSLHERPWMASAAMIARKFDLDVIPINIRARNSVLFYLFDMIHPTLRDITLFHETLNKHRQPFDLTVGRPIPARQLSKNSGEAIEDLRARTLRLGGRHAPAVSLVAQTRRPRWIKAALAN